MFDLLLPQLHLLKIPNSQLSSLAKLEETFNHTLLTMLARMQAPKPGVSQIK